MKTEKSVSFDYTVGEVELSYKPLKGSQKPKVNASDNAYKVIRPTFPDDKIQYKEYFKVLFLNNANEIVGYTTISEGGISETAVDLRIIYQAALLTNATGIILVHNHPSGSLKPSIEDKNVTKKICEAGRILRIHVLDHLILSDDSYYSFSDEGIMP